MPEDDSRPNITAFTPSHRTLDKKWLIACVLIFIVIIAGILINNHFARNNSSETTGYIDIDNGDTKVNWSRYTTQDIELSAPITITSSGVYHLTGSIADGAVIIDSGVKGEVKLILDNVSIANTAGPAISCVSGDDLVIELIGFNELKDGTSYDDTLDEDISGAIYSKADLAFAGEGSLDVTANYQDAIVGKDDVKFDGGTYTIVAADDGIRGKDSVYITDGHFDIVSQQDAIKSTNDTDTSKGFVLIEGGDIQISAGDDGIHGEHSLIIQSGSIVIAKSYEGLESPTITINGGDISIVSSDDGINAGSNSSSSIAPQSDVDENCIVAINDGDIYVNSSGDGIDSNGYIYFNGGTIIVDGPTNNDNGALDSGAGITMNGGTAVAVGSSGMAETLGSTSSVFNLSIFFASSIPAGATLAIRDSAGSTIVEHTSAKAFTNATIGSADFSLGGTYTIYLDNEKYQDFTIGSITTTIGNSRSNMMPPPGRK